MSELIRRPWKAGILVLLIIAVVMLFIHVTHILAGGKSFHFMESGALAIVSVLFTLLAYKAVFK